MNKGLAKSKTITEIRKLRNINPKDRKLKRFCKDLEKIISEEDNISNTVFYYQFDEVATILNRSNLNKIEKGYIFSKILKAHFIIIDTVPYSVINMDTLPDIFSKYGFTGEKISEIFLEYGQKGELSQYKLEFIEAVQLRLKQALRPDIILKMISVSLENGLSRETIEQREKEAKSFFAKLSETEKKYESLKKALNNLVYMNELKIYIANVTGLPLEESEELIYQYILDPSLKSYQKERLKELNDTLSIYVKKEEETRIKLVEFYKHIRKFMLKEKREIIDYQSIGKELLLYGMPCELVESLLLFYLDSEKLEEKEKRFEEPKRTKKQIKKELAIYYQEGKDIPFDYYNLGKFLELLQESNYADSVKINMLNGIWQHKIENEAYFAYLFQKNICNNNSKKEIKEIREILELMYRTKDKEEWEYFYEETLNLCQKLNPCLYNFDFELSLMKKNQ